MKEARKILTKNGLKRENALKPNNAFQFRIVLCKYFLLCDGKSLEKSFEYLWKLMP